MSDRIRLTIDGEEDVLAAARTHEGFVAGETLAVAVAYGSVDGGFEGKVGDGSEVRVAVERA